MSQWEEMLDEYALHPEAIAWYQPRHLRLTLAEQFEAVQECVKRGYLEWAGVVRKEWKDTLYRVTPAGRAYWGENVKDQRKRPAAASPVPRWTQGQLAAAQSPVSVFDLPRAPWRWNKRIEQYKEFGECEKS